MQEQVNTEVNKQKSDNTTKAANKKVQELMQTENRKSNIVFFNIPESSLDDVEERKVDNLKHVIAFLSVRMGKNRKAKTTQGCCQ